MSRYPVDKPRVDPSSPRAKGFAVDREAEVPLSVQLAWVLRSRIGSGELAPGERLPGLRELADAAGVNVNTARAVYQRLGQEGLIDSQQGSGTFVAGAPPRASVARAIATQAAREARSAGVDPRDVGAALYVTGETAQETEDEPAERRRLLRAQISALERTLSEMEASHPGLAPPPTPGRVRSGPTLLDAGELERVRTELVRRLSAMQAAIDGDGEGEGRNPPPPARQPASTKARQRAKPRQAAKKRAQSFPTTRPVPEAG